MRFGVNMKPFNFLIDRDVSKVATLFPAKRTSTIEDAGLPENASDSRIVEVAWELDAIIVTGNGDDFIKRMKEFSRQTKRKDCRDLRGLVILPSKFEIQKRVLNNLESRLRFNGKPIRWKDVQRLNLCVSAKAVGKNPEIHQFPKCFYCQKLDDD
jgi:hypothetical protein